jgi:alanine racemase
VAYERAAWVEVDLDAIAHNVRTLKALTPKGCIFMAVVKADAYGHGAVSVARAALRAGADRLGVATAEEAVELRAAGITAPVHLLSQPPASAVSVIIEQDIIPTLFSLDFATALGAAAAAAGRTATFHLKVDTGMNRIGVRAEDAWELARALREVPNIALGGVSTHFATADTPGDWGFARQAERFEAAVLRFRAEGIGTGIVHAANSAATILHPKTHNDMVRCGIAVYGLHPAEATRGRIGLMPAMAVKARVSMVKRIGIGEGVSYGFTYHAAGPTTIATLPLGYADGVHRGASDRMRVLIGGSPCRQVGRVCMDQLMVEVPPGLDVRAGDEAVLVGSQGEASIEMDELASAAGTINYEIACALAMRMPCYRVGGAEPVA